MSQTAYWNQMYANAIDQSEPSQRYRPALSIDGDKWCALYGDNLQDGVAGFGDSPGAAFWDFDRAWWTKLVTPSVELPGVKPEGVIKMAWTTLTNESKKFCSYENKTAAGKFSWWIEYIFRAAPRYWFYTAQDMLRCRRGA